MRAIQSPLYKNARIYIDGHFQTGGFEVTADGRFGTILPQDFSGEVVDLKGATVIPGLVDVHIHGAVGADFSDGDSAGLERMAAYLASAGVIFTFKVALPVWRMVHWPVLLPIFMIAW